MRRAPTVRLHRRERRALTTLAENSTSSGKVRLRARIVLRASEGRANQEVAEELGTDPGTVARWRRRYLVHGLAGIVKDAPRPGRPPVISDAQVESIARAARDPSPTRPARWSTRSLARETGVSKSTVQRIWRTRAPRPRRSVEDPRPSPGMDFVGKVTDMVGLYLNPPERAIAFSTDESIRTSRLEGGELRALADFQRRSRGVEFRAFLQVLDRQTPEPLDIHLLLDGRLAPTPSDLDRWLSQHPRFHLHYLPSDRSGLTLIDRLVTQFSRRRVRPGESPSAQRLRHSIREHFRESHGLPSPFIWTTAPQTDSDPVRRPPIRY